MTHWLVLEAGDAVARVDLQGGRLASMKVGDLELLVTLGDKATRWGSFPMIPWCGRLQHGRLAFGGATRSFPLSKPPHAIHGLTHEQAWEQVDDVTIRTDLVDPWPYGGYALQRFELTETSLTTSVEIHATGIAFPAMAGWHPWFRRTLERGGEAELSFEAGASYVTDDEMIPTGEVVPPPPGPWDTCFTRMTTPPTIRWPGALTLDVTSTFDHWVIFTEPDTSFCIEPQSGPPNEPNGTHPRIVEPDRPLRGSMTWAWVRE